MPLLDLAPARVVQPSFCLHAELLNPIEFHAWCLLRAEAAYAPQGA